MNICSVEKCWEKAIIKGLCKKHYQRLKEYGRFHKVLTGNKTKHPLYDIWNAKVRKVLTEEWKDFEKFVKDVGEKPKNTYLARIRVNEQYGPNNFWWKPLFLALDGENNKDRKERQRKELIKANPNLRRIANYKHQFNLTLDRYNELLKQQNEVCAICKRKETAKHKSGKIIYLAVDHCHKTNKIRGLLCTKCNIGIGSARDDVTILEAMIDYLKKHQ